MSEYTEIENSLIAKISDKDLRDSLSQIRKSAETIWTNEAGIIQGFTDHGFNHCLRLIKFSNIRLVEAMK